jgi:hypothetical protein
MAQKSYGVKYIFIAERAKSDRAPAPHGLGRPGVAIQA